MYIRIGSPWLLGSMCCGWCGTNGTIKGGQSQRLGLTTQCPQSSKIPQIHQLLLALYKRILLNCQTTTRPHKTRNILAMGGQRTTSIWNTKGQHGQQTSATTTQLWKDLLPPKWHLVAFYLATFSPTEQNYNAHDLEFWGVLKLIEHWWPYLIWTKGPFIPSQKSIDAGQSRLKQIEWNH